METVKEIRGCWGPPPRPQGCRPSLGSPPEHKAGLCALGTPGLPAPRPAQRVWAVVTSLRAVPAAPILSLLRSAFSCQAHVTTQTDKPSGSRQSSHTPHGLSPPSVHELACGGVSGVPSSEEQNSPGFLPERGQRTDSDPPARLSHALLCKADSKHLRKGLRTECLQMTMHRTYRLGDEGVWGEATGWEEKTNICISTADT